MRNIEIELADIYQQQGSLKPDFVVLWARNNPESALHKRFNWDDTVAAHQWRLQQARQIITEVEVFYPDTGKRLPVYVSPVENRGVKGYEALVDVLSDDEKRRRFLNQALEEYKRLSRRYSDLEEFAEIRKAVERVAAA